MHSNRFGCLTTTGMISALITMIAIVAAAFSSGSQMFTAGSLNNMNESGLAYGGVMSHAEITDCKSCHTAPWASETMADRCAACHTDIAKEMFSVAQLHGAIIERNSSLACRDCHPEHRGSSALLTELGGNQFPHEALGFSLNGHQLTSARVPFTCSDCHGEDVTMFASSTCESCHRQMDMAFAQAHLLAFGTDCLACHDGVDRFGADFTHAAFEFKLSGKHAEVTCADCHANSFNLAALQSAPQDCFSCHAVDDAHQARFGQDCGSCHSADGWTPATFDHNLSTFKLEGEHNEVRCEECHQNGVYLGTPTDCYSCHQQDDEHSGRFGTDCSACHTPSDWENATFDHNMSGFPLTGAHVNTACERCHTNGEFAGLSSTCVSCHAEPVQHAGQFGTDCAACHTTTAWTPAAFNGQHTFPMNHGEGGTVSCATCHPANYSTYSCYGCHEHNEGSVRSEHLEEGISDFQNCVECHANGGEDDGGGEGGGHGGGDGDDD